MALEPKEGILLDKDGTPVFGGGKRLDGRVLKFHASANPLWLLAIPVVLTLGLAFIIVVGILILPFWILRQLFRP